MSHNEILTVFAVRFPEYLIDTWFPNGKNSIRVRQSNGQDLVFTYRSSTDWRFETVKSFINK